MTFVRKVAVNISAFVERHASPGCKQWAEASARELAFVKGDWAALGWALSSTRVLLDYREAPLQSLADVPRVAYRFVEMVRSGYGMFPLLLQGPLYLGMLFGPVHRPERVGCAMIFGGSMLGWIFFLIERRRLKEPYKDEIYDDAAACAPFYKAELERRRFTLTITVCCLACFWVGVMLNTWHRLGGYLSWRVACFALSAFLVFGLRYAQRINRRRLERLEALLAEKI